MLVEYFDDNIHLGLTGGKKVGHAIFHQRSNILGVTVVSDCGILSTQQIIEIGKLTERIKIHNIKLTTRQTILFFIDSEDLSLLKDAIEAIGLSIGVFGNVVRNVKGCSGRRDLCKHSLGDAFGLGLQIQKSFMNQPTPKDFKISTAGCNRACTDPYCADFGVIAVGEELFNVYIGGRGGSLVPTHGIIIAKKVPAEEVIDLLDYLLVKYRELAESDERLCETIQRCGLKRFEFCQKI